MESKTTRRYETILTQLHQQQRSELSLSDEWETPEGLFNMLTVKHGLTLGFDVCATKENSKCTSFISPETNALDPETDWYLNDHQGVWCNPPHSKTGLFVKKAFEQHEKHNINIMMIMPANTMSTIYWHKYIEGNAEYHAIKGRIRFKIGGVISKHVSRNAYVCVIFRRNSETLSANICKIWKGL